MEEFSLLLPPGDLSSPEEWNAPLVIGIGQVAAYPLSDFVYDISSLDDIVSEYIADELRGVQPFDCAEDYGALPLGFVNAGFERSANDVFRIPRMLYAEYPDRTVLGMLILGEYESMPSCQEVIDRLVLPMTHSSDHTSLIGIMADGSDAGSSTEPADGSSTGPQDGPQDGSFTKYIVKDAGRSGSSSVHSDTANTIELHGRAALKEMISNAIDTIKSSELEKVVISWRETLTLSKSPTFLDTLFSMKANEPDCWLMASAAGDYAGAASQSMLNDIDTSNSELLSNRRSGSSVHIIGATPELILSRSGDIVTSSPLAGTLSSQMMPKDFEYAERSRNQLIGNSEYLNKLLLESPKNRLEHSITVDEIVSVMDRYCQSVAHSSQPGIIRLASIIHLETAITGELRADLNGPNTTLKLLNDLHPTPAVAGVPREIAMKKIAELEGEPRNRYAGITGWLAGNGDGFNVLNIRTAIIGDGKVRIQAGAGIVESSDVDDEVLEIEAKLRSIIRLLPI